MQSNYTHNLKIALCDIYGNIVVSDFTNELGVVIKLNERLDKIKEELCKTNTHEFTWNNKLCPFTITWTKIPLTKTNHYFMGDLCTNSIYDFDSILQKHTEITMKNFADKNYLAEGYTIRFYITRLIGDKKPLSQSFGDV